MVTYTTATATTIEIEVTEPMPVPVTHQGRIFSFEKLHFVVLHAEIPNFSPKENFHIACPR